MMEAKLKLIAQLFDDVLKVFICIAVFALLLLIIANVASIFVRVPTLPVVDAYRLVCLAGALWLLKK